MTQSTGRVAWARVEAKLPGYLEALLASDVFGRGPGRKPPPREHGVYLFTESGKHLYVGRCGLTERAAKRGGGHLPIVRTELQSDNRFRREFICQKERVSEMDFRVVKITDNFESYVFEPYAALMLKAPYNSWATS